MTPTGTVQFILYQGSSCTGAQLTSGLVALVAGVAPAAKATYSASWTPPKTGRYDWTAVYSGDVNYAGSSTACAAAGELVTVGSATATKATAITLASSSTADVGAIWDLRRHANGHRNRCCEPDWLMVTTPARQRPTWRLAGWTR